MPARSSTYYPTKQAEQAPWLRNFRSKLLECAAPLGLSADLVTSVVADADWMIYLLGTWAGAVRAWVPECQEYLRQLESGEGTPPLPVFAAPDAVGAVPVPAGALTRIFGAVQLIKIAPGCTAALALELGIVGQSRAAVERSAIHPEISVKRVGERVAVDWDWGDHRDEADMVELHVDRGDGEGWVLLASDTMPGYLDTSPPPTAPVKWKYRARFHFDGDPVGVWSAERAVAVGI